MYSLNRNKIYFSIQSMIFTDNFNNNQMSGKTHYLKFNPDRYLVYLMHFFSKLPPSKSEVWIKNDVAIVFFFFFRRTLRRNNGNFEGNTITPFFKTVFESFEKAYAFLPIRHGIFEIYYKILKYNTCRFFDVCHSLHRKIYSNNNIRTWCILIHHVRFQ